MGGVRRVVVVGWKNLIPFPFPSNDLNKYVDLRYGIERNGVGTDCERGNYKLDPAMVKYALD